LNGLCEKVLIETTKVFDACLSQTTETGVVLQLSNFNPANPTLPLTYISSQATTNQAVVSNLVIDRIDSCPNYANVSATITIPVTVTYRDANGVIGTATSSVVVNIEVKAAVENDYSVTAWLLEDGIYAKQTNATEEWMNTHDNAIRQRIESDAISGINLGTIAAGQTKSTAVVLKITGKDWVRDNMKVLIIASAKNSNGKFEVANVVTCPIGDSVTYEYL
jgi:hypothetical protein